MSLLSSKSSSSHFFPSNLYYSQGELLLFLIIFHLSDEILSSSYTNKHPVWFHVTDVKVNKTAEDNRTPDALSLEGNTADAARGIKQICSADIMIGPRFFVWGNSVITSQGHNEICNSLKFFSYCP